MCPSGPNHHRTEMDEEVTGLHAVAHSGCEGGIAEVLDWCGVRRIGAFAALAGTDGRCASGPRRTERAPLKSVRATLLLPARGPPRAGCCPRASPGWAG